MKKIKIKIFGKSAVAIHSLILRETEVDLSVYVGSNVASICRSRCYNRLLRYKRALDRVGEIENEIKQDFTYDGPFLVKRLTKESGQKPEAKKSLSSGMQMPATIHPKVSCLLRGLELVPFLLQALLCLPLSLLVLLALLLQ